MGCACFHSLILCRLGPHQQHIHVRQCFAHVSWPEFNAAVEQQDTQKLSDMIPSPTWQAAAEALCGESDNANPNNSVVYGDVPSPIDTSSTAQVEGLVKNATVVDSVGHGDEEATLLHDVYGDNDSVSWRNDLYVIGVSETPAGPSEA